MQLFCAEVRIVFPKKFLALKSMEKPPSKAAHNRPATFFMYWPGWPNSPETEILYH